MLSLKFRVLRFISLFTLLNSSIHLFNLTKPIEIDFFVVVTIALVSMFFSIVPFSFYLEKPYTYIEVNFSRKTLISICLIKE
jgi:hypothetical protein